VLDTTWEQKMHEFYVQNDGGKTRSNWHSTSKKKKNLNTLSIHTSPEGIILNESLF
jgi:hypothetical protein